MEECARSESVRCRCKGCSFPPGIGCREDALTAGFYDLLQGRGTGGRSE